MKKSKDSQKKKNWFLRHKIISGIIIFILLMIIIGSKNGDTQKGFQDGMNAAKETLETSDRSLEEKQEIFTKVSETEHRAAEEAEQKYPITLTNTNAEQAKENVEPYAELVQELEEKYRQEVLDEYGVSEDEWSKIATEGVTNNWPLSEITPTSIPTKATSVTSVPTTIVTTTSGYQGIYDKYTARLKAECPTLSITECAELANEGVSKMAEYMYSAKGTEGQYQTYSAWAEKLMDVYIQEAR